MTVGMLWQDLSKDTLQQKILRAAAYYRKKYGRTPNSCFVHPSVVTMVEHIDAITVRPSQVILPSYFWIGIDEALQDNHGD